MHRAIEGLREPDQNNRVVVVQPISTPVQSNGHTPSAISRPNRRQLLFRCVRLVLAGALLASAALYTRRSLTSARSEQAYINAEITALRAPIVGQLRLEPVILGRKLSAGAPLFSIENPRYGGQEAILQLNWLKESAERLRAESDEAALRFRQQQEVFQIHERLYAEKVLSRLALLEEETKLALARTAMTNKQALATQAEERRTQCKKQLDLQKSAVVTMPFDGVAWALPARNGVEVSLHETVLQVINPKGIWVDAFFHERHAEKLAAGKRVHVRALDGEGVWGGTVESVRGGVGRIPFDGAAAVSSGDYTRRRIAVRVQMDTASPFDASRFFGVGRSVVVTLSNHE